MRASGPLLLYLDGLSPGGVEQLTLNLAEGLLVEGWEIHLALNRAIGALLHRVPPKVQLHDLGARRYLQAVVSLARLVSELRPQILLSQRAYLNTIALLAAKLSGCPVRVVLGEHSQLLKWLAEPSAPKRTVDRMLPLLLPLFYRHADAVYGCSQGVAKDLERLLGWPAGRVPVLTNPVLPDSALSDTTPRSPANPPLIVGMGRLSPEKGFDLLLQAFALVRERLEAHLAIVGDGPELGRLRELAWQLGVAGEVAFPGYSSVPAHWLARASVFALSSHLESFPTVIIEAMNLGTPVVAFDCPAGPREIITQDRDGLLVQAGDPKSLAAGMLAVLQDPALSSRLAAGGLLRAQDFAYRRTIASYGRLLAGCEQVA